MKRIKRNTLILLPALLLVLVAYFSLGGCKRSSKGTREDSMNILQNQPVFELSVKSFGVMYGALVNDVYIHTQFDPEAADDLTLPINHFFTSGKNQVALKVIPEQRGGLFNPAATLELFLTVRESGKKETYTLHTSKFSGASPPEIRVLGNSVTYRNAKVPFDVSESGEIEISGLQVSPMKDYDGGLDIVQYIDVPSSLPRWKFFDSDRLPHPTNLSDDEYDKALTNLFGEYEKIQNALVAKDIDSIIMLFDERSQELDQAFYEPPGTTQSQLRETLLETVNDSELEISFVRREWLGFGLSETSTLRALSREGGGAAIAYNYKDGGSRSFPIVFRRENGKWIITR